METALIDEKELVQRLVKETQDMNISLDLYCQKKIEEMKLPPFVGGIMTIPCSEDMSIEQFFKNTLAVFSSNFAESVSFQCENVRMMQIIERVSQYLTDRGIEDDYQKYKQEYIIRQREFMTLGKFV